MTFCTLTFCTRFVNSTSLAINEKSYLTLSAHRPVTFVDVFGAPFELADDATVTVRRALPWPPNKHFYK